MCQLPRSAVTARARRLPGYLSTALKWKGACRNLAHNVDILQCTMTSANHGADGSVGVSTSLNSRSLQRPKFLPPIDESDGCIDKRLAGPSALFRRRLARI